MRKIGRIVSPSILKVKRRVGRIISSHKPREITKDGC